MAFEDFALLQAAAPELERYLFSEVLYYPLTSGSGRRLSGDTSRLTIGNILLAIKKLQADDLPPAEAGQLTTLLEQIEQVRTRWRTLWQKKVMQEIPNRLNLWRDYLERLSDSTSTGSGDYRYNVRTRVILELLLDEVDDLPPQKEALLRSMDLKLKAMGTPGKFIWDEPLREVFPEDRFWYLYLQV